MLQTWHSSTLLRRRRPSVFVKTGKTAMVGSEELTPAPPLYGQRLRVTSLLLVYPSPAMGM